jgi:hypothetical protein
MVLENISARRGMSRIASRAQNKLDAVWLGRIGS